MLRFAKPDVARGYVPATAAGRADEDVYDRHAGNLYRQALFTLGDTAMAEQVVSDVLVGECVRPAAAIRGQDARGRLAISAYRRCMELAGSPAWTARLPADRAGSFADPVGPGGLNARKRGALGLVLFGGAGYRQAAVDLGVPASDMTALLRAAVAGATASGPGSLPCASQDRAWL
jgi:hypothetical protein